MLVQIFNFGTFTFILIDMHEFDDYFLSNLIPVYLIMPLINGRMFRNLSACKRLQIEEGAMAQHQENLVRKVVPELTGRGADEDHGHSPVNDSSVKLNETLNEDSEKKADVALEDEKFKKVKKGEDDFEKLLEEDVPVNARFDKINELFGEEPERKAVTLDDDHEYKDVSEKPNEVKKKNQSFNDSGISLNEEGIKDEKLVEETAPVRPIKLKIRRNGKRDCDWISLIPESGSSHPVKRIRLKRKF